MPTGGYSNNGPIEPRNQTKDDGGIPAVVLIFFQILRPTIHGM
jgi:hypothetical protein